MILAFSQRQSHYQYSCWIYLCLKKFNAWAGVASLRCGFARTQGVRGELGWLKLKFTSLGNSLGVVWTLARRLTSGNSLHEGTLKHGDGGQALSPGALVNWLCGSRIYVEGYADELCVGSVGALVFELSSAHWRVNKQQFNFLWQKQVLIKQAKRGLMFRAASLLTSSPHTYILCMYVWKKRKKEIKDGMG